MSINILVSRDGKLASLYDSASMWAFGPVLHSRDEAEAFLKWLPHDARTYPEAALEVAYHKWLAEAIDGE